MIELIRPATTPVAFRKVLMVSVENAEGVNRSGNSLSAARDENAARAIR